MQSRFSVRNLWPDRIRNPLPPWGLHGPCGPRASWMCHPHPGFLGLDTTKPHPEVSSLFLGFKEQAANLVELTLKQDIVD